MFKIATKILIIVFLFSVQSFAQGQEITINGKVKDESGLPMPGVSVVVKGTTVGTVTGIEGDFSFKAPTSSLLVFSFIGYETQEISISESNMEVVLKVDNQKLDEVVVTALGIKREKKSLGYSVTEVRSDEFADTGETNPIASLSGKVAGVDINQTTAGPSGSSRIIIRGISEVDGNNQPLYVIDGVPVQNGSIGQADSKEGGFDMGDGLSDINPEDIESISVLKGASASALYGSRALNGVILITTKKGSNSKDLNVTFSSVVTFDFANTDLDERQTIYGQGNGTLWRDGTQDISNGDMKAAWGYKLSDYQDRYYHQVNGDSILYGAKVNAIKDFFDVGVTTNTNVSVNGGDDRTTFAFSYSNVSNSDIIPGSKLAKNSFNLRGTHQVSEKISVDAKATYIRDKVENRPSVGGQDNNIGNALAGLAPNIPLSTLKNYKDSEGKYYNVFGNKYDWNPYWTLNETYNESNKNRLIGFVSTNIEFTDYLNLNLKAGLDQYSMDFVNFLDRYTPNNEIGTVTHQKWDVSEENYSALLNFNKTFSDFTVGASLGANLMKYKNKNLKINGLEVNVPDGGYELNNFATKIVTPSGSQKEIQSVYGFVNLGYKDFLFLDITGRNDWSSTLPTDNNSFFYPSVSSSLILKEAFNLDLDWLTYGKIRASIAQVGGDTDPYRLAATYATDASGLLSETGYATANPNLKPEMTTSWELGTDLRFFNNRIGLDFTYYKQSTVDLIMALPVSLSTSSERVMKNAGELENKGFEVLLSTTPLKLDNGLRWDLNFNFSKNENTVVKLSEGVEAITIAETKYVTVTAREGERFGQIIGNKYARTDDGQIIHGSNGFPTYTDPEVLGNSLPDWTGGISSKLSFKGLSFRASIDVRYGGEIFSGTNLSMYNRGTHTGTLEGRDEWQNTRETNIAAGRTDIADYTDVLGYVGKGVVESIDADGNVIYTPNTTNVDPSKYWADVAGESAEQFVYDATYVKLRDLAISYTLPKHYLNKLNLPIKSFTLGVVGRNLFTIYKNVPNIDPESTYNNSNGQGVERGSLPGRKQYGFNIKMKF